MSDPPWHARPVEIIACLGSRTTASRGPTSGSTELEKRPQNSRFRFVNLGAGGDLSFNTVGHLGTNDILASVFPKFRRFVHVSKRFCEEPSSRRPFSSSRTPENRDV
jgi:hypothetical protein